MGAQEHEQLKDHTKNPFHKVLEKHGWKHQDTEHQKSVHHPKYDNTVHRYTHPGHGTDYITVTQNHQTKQHAGMRLNYWSGGITNPTGSQYSHYTPGSDSTEQSLEAYIHKYYGSRRKPVDMDIDKLSDDARELLAAVLNDEYASRILYHARTARDVREAVVSVAEEQLEDRYSQKDIRDAVAFLYAHLKELNDEDFDASEWLDESSNPTKGMSKEWRTAILTTRAGKWAKYGSPEKRIARVKAASKNKGRSSSKSESFTHPFRQIVENMSPTGSTTTVLEEDTDGISKVIARARANCRRRPAEFAYDTHGHEAFWLFATAEADRGTGNDNIVFVGCASAMNLFHTGMGMGVAPSRHLRDACIAPDDHEGEQKIRAFMQHFLDKGFRLED